MRLLLHALLLVAGLAIARVVLSRRQPFPLATFVLAGAGWHAVLGLALHGRMLVAQAGRAFTAAAWLPIFLVGFVATGAVAALACLGLAEGLRRWLAARREARRPTAR